MIHVIVIVILVLMIAGVSLYLYKAKKRGEKCIGCPYAKQCGNNQCSCKNVRK